MNLNITLIAIGGLTLIFMGLFTFLLLKTKSLKKGLKKAEEEISVTKEEARKEAERIKREAEIETKEKLINLKSEFERQTRDKRNKLNEMERRLLHKEETLEKKSFVLESREREISKRERELYSKERSIEDQKKRYDELISQEIKELEKISGLTQEEAKKLLISKIESDARHEASQIIKSIEEEIKETANLQAKKILSLAIQKTASEHVVESTITIVDLPSDEMKGRIIGREGRNIRALEMCTGVDLIVDDTPESVTISSFDPIRREIARISLDRLILDGRIHPARIEEVVEKVKEEFEEKIKQEGETVILEFGLKDIHPELVKLLGKLKYRTSYGQNVLNHSKEVAYLSAFMAAELRANSQIALRAGLLHDIGKAIDREIEGTHTELSVELAKKYGENEEIVKAIASHHQEVEFPSIEAVLVQAADSLSAARPGARRELLENYIKRLEKLEEIGKSFDGVSKCYALQAGREVRIIVESQRVNDEGAIFLSREIAKRIKSELEFPGQIKVTVIREMRAVEYAR
ncbi:MAG: ribonuclease Y [Acidobacteriota bacterium]